MNARCGSEIERKAEAKPWHPVKNTIADILSKPSYWQLLSERTYQNKNNEPRYLKLAMHTTKQITKLTVLKIKSAFTR